MAVEEKNDLESKSFVIPEGKELANAKVFCDKHGEITDSAFFFSYQTKQKDGKVISHNNVFCVCCLSEYLEKLQKQNELGAISIVPILRDKIKKTEAETTEEPTEAKTQD